MSPTAHEAPVQDPIAEFQPGTPRAPRSIGKLQAAILGVGWGIVAALFAFVVYFACAGSNVPEEFGPFPPEHPFHDATALLFIALAIVFAGAYCIRQFRSLRQK